MDGVMFYQYVHNPYLGIVCTLSVEVEKKIQQIIINTGICLK